MKKSNYSAWTVLLVYQQATSQGLMPIIVKRKRLAIACRNLEKATKILQLEAATRLLLFPPTYTKISYLNTCRSRLGCSNIVR